MSIEGQDNKLPSYFVIKTENAFVIISMGIKAMYLPVSLQKFSSKTTTFFVYFSPRTNFNYVTRFLNVFLGSENVCYIEFSFTNKLNIRISQMKWMDGSRYSLNAYI